MKKSLMAILFLVSVCSAQNWNVFNKTYRYNYKLNNSPVISNVLFVETVSLIASDTLYNMNPIGVVSGTVLLIGQPQFLRGNIVKKSDGSVKFQAPGNITILPTCTLNQTWLYDATLNYSATCVGISTVSIFSTIDSVRTIIVNNTDSVLLSKQFGLIKYPFQYAQNQYYRLVGIERAASYDSVALHGEKVPNAWDFYKFNVGDKWCRNNVGYNQPNTTPYYFCISSTIIVNSRTITSNGYIYNVTNTTVSHYSGAPCGALAPTITTGASNLTYTDNTQASLIENKMYPNMAFTPSVAYSGFKVLGHLGTDNSGNIYKYYGVPNCGFTMNNFVASDPSHALYGNDPPPANYPLYTDGNLSYSESWCTSFGLVSSNMLLFEAAGDDCLNCFVRNNVLIVGTGLAVNAIHEEKTIFPNPGNSSIKINFAGAKQLKIYNNLGTLVRNETIIDKDELDISGLPNGLYFLEIQTDSFESTQKLIIQH
jgi:hypothetical protein